MIRAGESGPVKLGHAADPVKRLADLQVAHWEKLRIIRLWEGGLAEEAALHVQFADLYIRGEWFAFSRTMLGAIGLQEIEYVSAELPSVPGLPPPISEVVHLPLGQRIAVARNVARLTQRELALALGVSGNAVAQWETVGKGIRTERLVQMAAVLGVSVDWLLTPDKAA